MPIWSSPLLRDGVRFQGDKLNMKTAIAGSPVEWHQDFAFYPHTTDDLLAVGIALDDSTLENGCLMAMCGSHLGPVLDHHQDGVFIGAISPSRESIDLGGAVPLEIKAGGRDDPPYKAAARLGPQPLLRPTPAVAGSIRGRIGVAHDGVCATTTSSIGR